MTSSMLAGERRWASARRGGMTVLGKVSVPKPLNLPSQRLENHGLDPNVEIVPKGTLSWGSRSSSSASNAWGSSTLSPNADGSAGSPRNLSGLPSSSGSSTRPSSADSNRIHEPTLSAWSPQSRPSSASGALTSNRTSLISSRPRSAETRPGSSQLSRFAGLSSDNSVPCSPPGTTEKLGVTSTKNNGFSLSSGDFPTLGSEREIEPQEHGACDRPGSSSSRISPAEERNTTSSVGDASANANAKSGTASIWKRDGSRHDEDGFRPGVEKWQGDPQPYLNTSVPPQHFDAWHGPPINAPGGVWYRGPPGGPPYGPPVAPGGYPIEPFPYYRPQIPPTALANSHPIPPPGAGPRGPHPKNGDLYRPHIPDAYIRPGMPIRPGFYPGPMAYEGYYGPPMGYCNSNERDIPFMGMQARPSVYNRYPSQNAPDPNNHHGTVGAHGSTGKTMASGQVESGHPDNTRGPCEVLLKRHNEWGGKEEEGKWEQTIPANAPFLEKWEQTIPANAPYLEKGDQPRVHSLKNEWGADRKKDEKMHSRRLTPSEDAPSRTFNNRAGYSSDSVKLRLPERLGNGKAVDDILARKSGNAASALPDVPQIIPATPKDSTLMQKIEDLNAKARASDGRHDVTCISSSEEQNNRLQVGDAKANLSANTVGSGAMCAKRTNASGDIITVSQEVDVSARDKTAQTTVASGTSLSRRASHGMQGRTDHHSKRFNTKDADGWQKKSLASGSINAVSSANLERTFNVHVEEHHTSVGAAEKSGINLQKKDEEESLTPMFDPSDCDAQRAKMREIAKQRAKLLQKEEEERTREQKAKALAKLEELNRRIQVADGSTQKFEKVLPGAAMPQEQEVSQSLAEPAMVSSKCEKPSSSLVFNPDVVAQISEGNTSVVEPPDTAQQEPVVPCGQPSALHKDAQNAGAADCKAAPQVNDGGVSRQKRLGSKQKLNVPSERKFTEEPVPTILAEAPKNHSDVAVNDNTYTEVVAKVGPSCEPYSPINPNIMAESTTHQRKKNRSSKSKHKLETSVTTLPSSVPKETNPAKTSIGVGQSKASEFELDTSSAQSLTDAKHAIQPSEQHSVLPSEEATGRVNNQWKSQQSRRMPRNPQAIRSAKFHSSDAVVWAPVQLQNKSEVTDDSHKNSYDAVTPIVKSENLVQNSLKSKRAEMERYVPKPVAKELAQQGSIQQPLSASINQTTSDETVGRAEPSFQSIESSQPASSAIGNIVSTESGNGNSKQSKAHGSWRLRVSSELPHVKELQDGSSFTSDPGKNVQESIEHQSSTPNVNSVGQPKFSDELNTSEGCNTKDKGVTDRGKRHPFKGHRSSGSYQDLDRRNINSENTYKSYQQSAAPEISHADRTGSTGENRGAGERTSSHWKPKSQAYSGHDQRGSRFCGGQNVNAEVGRPIKKDFPPQDRVHLPPQHDKESSEITAQPLPHPHQSLPERKSVVEAQNVGHQEARREKKVASFKGRPYSPNQGPVNMVEPAPPADMDTRHEQRSSSGFHKNGNPNNRSGRGHESRGEWSSAGQDSKQHNVPANRERQRHSSHYEYQPVGSYNNSKSKNFEGQDGSHNTSSRYRERGQGHSKRGGGNFYGQQSSNVGANTSGYD